MKFADYVVLEQVRALEEQRSPDRPLDGLETFVAGQSQGFAHALRQRARALTAEHEWGGVIAAPAQWYKRLTILVWVLFALLGVVAVLNALSGEASSRVLNIYGVLLVLLGFNLISIMLWLLGCIAKLGGLISGTLGSLPVGIENLLRRFRQRQGQTAYTAWQESHFAGSVGVWRLSLVSHSIWLSYLSAGLVCLLVLFSIRQYDFIWGSTLLSGGTFVDLTRALGAPLQFLGVSMPDATQVLASQSGTITERNLSGTEIRRQWAWFLLGAIAVYGLLPRLLATLVSFLALRHSEARYRPDFYLPYYVELKHSMRAETGKTEVIDADTEPRTINNSEKRSPTPQQLASTDLPADAYVAGFELESNLAESLHQNIVGRESYAAMLQTISSAKYVLAVVVDLNAVPDRGTTRKLVELFASAKASFLVLLDDDVDGESHERQRLADWYELAANAAVPVDHVYRMSAAQLTALTANR